MADQLTLDFGGADLPAIAQSGRVRRSLDERYRDWLAEHGETFGLFAQLCWDLRRAGHRRIGAKAVAERIRWEGLVNGPGDDGEGHDAYRVPNQYVSRMVRTLIEADPSWGCYFETRRLQS